jgi:hypothetical protein
LSPFLFSNVWMESSHRVTQGKLQSSDSALNFDLVLVSAYRVGICHSRNHIDSGKMCLRIKVTLVLSGITPFWWARYKVRGHHCHNRGLLAGTENQWKNTSRPGAESALVLAHSREQS